MGAWIGVMFGFAKTETRQIDKNTLVDIKAAKKSRLSPDENASDYVGLFT
jgi:hypothetical protein